MTAHPAPSRLSPAPGGEIDLTAVAVEYAGKKGNVRALKGVSLHIRPNEFLAIVGRSGSGKSTLLRVIGGLIPPSEGTAALGGEPIVRPPSSARFVAQDYTQSLLPWLTVEDNIRFGIRHAVRPDADPDGSVARMLDLVGLAHARSRYPGELSGGMQQRVAIARALASQPSVLLLDEAFSSVDALSRAKLQDMILGLWETLRFTAVLVTHDIDEAVYLADRVAVMQERGAGIAALVDVDLPHPRHQVETRERPDYLAYRRELAARVLTSDLEGAAA
ncbi:ABC transporter ATP-binding protein [Aquabacter sp. CN5-332]|uniref:ABC transporter ATP-binding protein n=1 Tax=Aquabacter sp. CN5-332 TaxID=3156608 RepID=UPI0032B39F77